MEESAAPHFGSQAIAEAARRLREAADAAAATVSSRDTSSTPLDGNALLDQLKSMADNAASQLRTTDTNVGGKVVFDKLQQTVADVTSKITTSGLDNGTVSTGGLVSQGVDAAALFDQIRSFASNTRLNDGLPAGVGKVVESTVRGAQRAVESVSRGAQHAIEDVSAPLRSALPETSSAASTSGLSSLLGGDNSVMSAPAAVSPIVDDVTAAAGQLLQPLTQGSSSAVEPHFGSRAIQQLLDDITTRLDGFPAASEWHTADVMAVYRDLRAVVDSIAQHAAALVPDSARSTAQHVMSSLQNLASSQNPAAAAVGRAMEAGQTAMERLGDPNTIAAAIAALTVVAGVLATAPRGDEVSSTHTSRPPPLPQQYDAAAVAAHFEQRPIAVIRRSCEVALELLRYAVGVLSDSMLRRAASRSMPLRARQLRESIEHLGPAYIKVAQALSTRVDLVPEEYLEEIRLLQDRVPPFSCDVAKEVLADEWGRSVASIVASLSPTPVASASLGQVYRAVLRPEYGSEVVAVKVQRPAVLQRIALDLYILRNAAAFLESRRLIGLRNGRTDWVALLDEWAFRFFEELDFLKEAGNAALFGQQMEERKLNGICVAEPRMALCTTRVLVTRWIDGEKLTESRAADVRELCNTLLNCYLVQLLETGLLHADPHPGNLIRTPDGKICILDFGLVTVVTTQQRYALVEYIAHLTIRDWRRVPIDLQRLGFIPAGLDPREAGLVEPLAVIFAQLLQGGGAKRVNIDAVIAQLNDLAKVYPFRIPPFFLLVLRAFSLIEGTALSVDPNYAIVRECFPYIARRLLSDDDPRLNQVLRDVLYGDGHRMDVNRLRALFSGFSEYTTDALLPYDGGSVVQQRLPSPVAVSNTAVVAVPAASHRGAVVATAPAAIRPLTAALPPMATGAASTVRVAPQPVLDDTARAVLTAMFSKRGTYIQDLLVEELAVAADALSRQTVMQLTSSLLRSFPSVLTLSTVQALGPFRLLLFPFPTPPELLRFAESLAQLNEEDESAIDSVRALLQATNADQSLARAFETWDWQAFTASAREVAEFSPQLLPGLSYTATAFVRALFRRVALRAADELSSERIANATVMDV